MGASRGHGRQVRGPSPWSPQQLDDPGIASSRGRRKESLKKQIWAMLTRRRMTSTGDRAGGRWRRRYQGSVVQDLFKGLRDVEFGNWIILFGASFLLSVLPLIIILSALANSRVDDNIATRLGLNHEGSHIVDTLFTSSHTGFNFGVAVALALSLLGTIAVARLVQRLYQQVFEHLDDRGWSNVLRCLVWALAAAAEVYVDAVISRPLRDLPAGRVFLGLGNLVIVTAFFWWGLHYLLRGRRRLGEDCSLLRSPRGSSGSASAGSPRSISLQLSSPTVTCMERSGWCSLLSLGSSQWEP